MFTLCTHACTGTMQKHTSLNCARAKEAWHRALSLVKQSGLCACEACLGNVQMAPSDRALNVCGVWRISNQAFGNHLSAMIEPRLSSPGLSCATNHNRHKNVPIKVRRVAVSSGGTVHWKRAHLGFPGCKILILGACGQPNPKCQY